MSEATSAGRIDLDLGVNYRQFNRQLMGISNNAESMVGSKFSKLGKLIGVAFAVGAIVNFGKKSMELASNLNEVQNVVDVTFGGMRGQINDFAKDALFSFGMSELSAKKFTSTIGAMMKSSKITGQQLVDMSEGVTALAGDMASFYNLSQEDAFTKISAGLAGETEPLRRLGVNMTVANLEAYALSKGITKSYQAMTQAEQTLLRYNFLMNATSDAQGDFARTSGSWANQVRLMSEQWKIFSGTMGQGFINMLAPILRGLNWLIQRLQIAAQYFRAFTELVFGAQNVTSTTAASTDDMTDAVGGAGKATKKAGKDVKSSLASFDEINTLATQTADSMDGIAEGAGAVDLGQGNVAVGVDTTGVDQFKSKIIELGADIQRVASYFGIAFAPGIELAKGIFDGFRTSATKVFNDIKLAALPIFNWFATEGVSLFSSYTSGVMLVLQGLLDSIKLKFDTVWDTAVRPGLDLLSSMILDTLNIIKGFWDKWGGDIIAGITTAIDNVKILFLEMWTYVQPIVQTFLDTLSWLWDNHFKGVLTGITDLVGKLITGALDIYNKFIVPVTGWLLKTFGPIIKEVFQTAIEVIGTLLATVLDIAAGILKSLGGIIDFIVGIFTGDWKKAWGGVKDVFSGIIDSIVAVFKGGINLIIDAVNFMVRQLNKIKFDVPSWVPILGGKTWGFSIPAIPKLAEGGIAYAPTLAMVGDNKNSNVDPEVISPLSKLQDMVANAVIAAMQAAGAMSNKQSTTGDIIFQVDGVTFARIFGPFLDRENQRVGNNVIIQRV